MVWLFQRHRAALSPLLFVLLSPKAGKRLENVKHSFAFQTCFFLKTAFSWLDLGPAYYEDPISSNPTYTKCQPCLNLFLGGFDASVIEIITGRINYVYIKVLSIFVNHATTTNISRDKRGLG